MTLMVKPTFRCQFKCDFCSAGMIQNHVGCDPDEDRIVDIVKEIHPDDLIVTGGDPLIKSVSFYKRLLQANDNMKLSFTTNLWDFHQHPEKWVELFRDQRVSVCTSFQYGCRRKKPDSTPYTESDFVEVSQEFKRYVGYVPPFISVISDENESQVYDHIKLAKKLGTTCRLNGVNPIGLANDYYPRYKMLKHYIHIYDIGLADYEENTRERHRGNCPFNTCGMCSHSNRSCCITDGKIRYSYCEDLSFLFDAYNLSTSNIDDLTKISNQITIPRECMCCKMMRICNGCMLHRFILHRKNFKTDKYCAEMNSLYDDLKRIGFKL